MGGQLTLSSASNILDVPNFFWDSEPTLHPLYVAIREYLEIDPRIKTLNERCRVFLDLSEILADSVADSKMSYITWIIIILIIISIIVTVTEVGLRFGMLSKEKGKQGDGVVAPIVGDPERGGGPGNVIGGGNGQIDLLRRSLAERNITLEDLRMWNSILNEKEKEVVCGGEIVGRTFKGV